jgi:hypothetical protein
MLVDIHSVIRCMVVSFAFYCSSPHNCAATDGSEILVVSPKLLAAVEFHR